MPVKNKRIKRNSQEWFDNEISEKLTVQDKGFRKYSKTRQKKIENKLEECIGKLKDLWKAIKSLRLPWMYN